MAMEIITGYTGIEHVTSADDAAIYRGIFGQDDYVLNVGSKLEATIIDNNTIKVADGDLVIQGHQARIRANDYEELTINNGTIGEKRHDLIVARYERDTNTGIESIDLIVKEGQSGVTAQDPTVELGDVAEGATVRELPIYRVKLDGLNITGVEKLFDTSKTLKDFDSHTSETSAKHIHSSGSNNDGHWIKFDDGTMICTQTINRTNVDMTEQYGPLYREPQNDIWTFPQPFIQAQYANLRADYRAPFAYVDAVYNDNISYRGCRITQATVNTVVRFQAMGRWKERA